MTPIALQRAARRAWWLRISVALGSLAANSLAAQSAGSVRQSFDRLPTRGQLQVTVGTYRGALSGDDALVYEDSTYMHVFDLFAEVGESLHVYLTSPCLIGAVSDPLTIGRHRWRSLHRCRLH